MIMSLSAINHELILLGLLWLGYFLLHSLFASLWLKARVATRWPGLMPYYRLGFNTLAVVLILPPLALMWRLGGELLWQYQGGWDLLRFSLMGVALAGFVWSLRYYDGREFLGLRQLHENLHQIEDQEQLHISPLHRFVRHPWYSLGLVLIWTQEMDAARLTSALMMTGYLILGSLLEERKLLIYHGKRYRRYRQRVPGLIPMPHRYLTREQADKLVQEGD
jgi:protein-S-isoprenylcysteine O-methyltransferase Ste14